MRLNHTEVVSADELESIHEASLTILERIGMDIWDVRGAEHASRCRGRCRRGAATRAVPAGDGPQHIVNAPAEFTLHSWNPERNLHIGGTWMANGTVGSAPQHRRPRRCSSHR